MIQELTGRSSADVVQDRILDPLGMERSAADPARPPSGLSHGHVTLFGVPVQADAPVRRHRDGADNLIATAPELARFAIAVGLPTHRGPALLSAAGLKAMATPPRIEGVTYGLGWEVDEHRGARYRVDARATV